MVSRVCFITLLDKEIEETRTSKRER